MERYKLSRSQSRCWWNVWSRVRSLLERTHRSWFGTWPTFLASAEGRTTTGPLAFGAWWEKYTFWTALHKYNICSTTTHKKSESTYSKSVAAFSSVTGVNEMTFLLRPRTHAVSGELANTWSGRGTRKCWRQSAAARGLVFFVSHIFAQSRTISEIFSQFLGEPLDGPHAQLGAEVSVEGRRRPSLQRKDNSWMNEIKICCVLWWTHKDACVEAVPAGDVPTRWLCSQRCPSPPMNTAYGWSLLCSFHGISHSCGETENEKANAVSIKFCFGFNLELHNYNDRCFSIVQWC